MEDIPKLKIENIEIDEVQVVESFVEEHLYKPQQEQLEAVRSFLISHLKNALNPRDKVPKEIEDRIWDQESVKQLSLVLQDQYGVCVEWHVVSQVLLNRVGIETVFRIGEIPNAPLHTYLDVKIDRTWQIFDPFAERYLADVGSTGTQFQDEYYKDSFSKK